MRVATPAWSNSLTAKRASALSSPMTASRSIRMAGPKVRRVDRLFHRDLTMLFLVFVHHSAIINEGGFKSLGEGEPVSDAHGQLTGRAGLKAAWCRRWNMTWCRALRASRQPT